MRSMIIRKKRFRKIRRKKRLINIMPVEHNYCGIYYATSKTNAVGPIVFFDEDGGVRFE